METAARQTITVENTINAPIEKVWVLWTAPQHIINWNSASEDWHTPRAENDLKAGGKFSSRMEAKDGSIGFDFGGTYDVVKMNEYIEYTMDDDRKVKIWFSKAGDQTKIVERFEAEQTNAIELQRDGWQSILDNFKKYSESFKD